MYHYAVSNLGPQLICVGNIYSFILNTVVLNLILITFAIHVRILLLKKNRTFTIPGSWKIVLRGWSASPVGYALLLLLGSGARNHDYMLVNVFKGKH